jgi:hypothetical protein
LYADPVTHRLLVDSASGSGTVTTVSVVTANGFAGTVANPTTTPAITLTTTVTGIIKGNGTAISAATANTDYQSPITLTTTGSSGVATFNGTTLNIPNYVTTISLTVGTTTIASGTTTRVLFDNAGVLGEYTISGSGNVAMTTSPVFTTPALGTPSSGVVTNLTGTASININGTVGATTPGTGAFTTLSASSTLTASTTIELGNASDTTLSRVSAGVIAVEGITVPTISSTSTFTNKRVTPRVLSAASYTTDTGSSLNGDTQDMFIVTAQTGALKFNNPSGTPTDGQKLIISVASSTTSARALTWDTAFGATTVALPSTTAATTATLTIGFIWSASKSLWQCVAVA